MKKRPTFSTKKLVKSMRAEVKDKQALRRMKKAEKNPPPTEPEAQP